MYFIKPLVIKSITNKHYEYAYKRLIYHPEYFSDALQKQQTASDGYQHLGITSGNPAAATTIIKIDNPFCKPCAEAHGILEDIIRENSDVNVRIIFNVSNDKKDERGVLARHFLAMQEAGDEHQLQNAMHEWYASETKDYKKFAAKYPVTTDTLLQEKKITEMGLWCRKAGISLTPSFFINGKALPADYKIEDIKYILQYQ